MTKIMYSPKLKELSVKSENLQKSKFYSYIRQNKNKKIIDLLKIQTNFLTKPFSIRERLFYVKNDIFTSLKCKNCDNLPIWNWRKNCYKKYCSKCVKSSKETLNKRISTNLHKYGVENISQNENIKKLKDKTKLDRYGDKNYNNRLKFKNTCIKKYNGIGLGSDVISDKIYKTNLYRYKSKNPFQSKTIIKNIRHKQSNNYHRKFLKISNNIHNNKYEYNRLKNSHDRIEIICPEHGSFYQKMYVHMRGNGCPKCASSGFSKKAISWLEYISETESIHIQHALNGGEHQIPGTNYRVDGFCQETNTCYEFLGDFWHGNTKIYDMNEIVHPNGMSVKECYKNTMERLKEIKNLGYNIEYIWENDYDKNYK